MKKVLTATMFLLLNNVTGFGQTSYKGLTPGKSMRTEVERALGAPVREVSETLIEYTAQPLSGRIFIQYRESSTLVEKVEMLCRSENSTCEDFISSLNLRLSAVPDADEINDQKWKSFYGPPLFVVVLRTKGDISDNKTPVSRFALYSRELFEAEIARVRLANSATPNKTDKSSITGGVLDARAVDKPAAVYPASALAMRIAGLVIVQVTVDEQGRVVDAFTVSGHPLLRQAAVDAARRARFDAGTTKLTGRLTYRFDP